MLLVTGQLSVGRLFSCFASSLVSYFVVALLLVCVVSGVCHFVIKMPPSRIVQINYVISIIVAMWFLWRTWECLGITVNL